MSDLKFYNKQDKEELVSMCMARDNKINSLQQENKQLKDKIDKAIEYIKEHTLIDYYGMPCFNNTNYINELLEILGEKE